MPTLAERYPGAALVTGASSGIGAAFARALARHNMDVVLVARRETQLRVLAGELERDHRVRTLVVPADLAAPDAHVAVAGAVAKAGLQVSFLVNNAGFGVYGLFRDNDPARDATMIDLNCRAPVMLAHAFLPAMLAKKRGAVIFVSSIGAFQSTPRFAVYCATKAFDLMVAEALHLELRRDGVDVLGVNPGPTSTEFNDVSGYADAPPFSRTPEAVVRTALRALGRKASVTDGCLNKLMTFFVRLVSRRMAARLAGAVMAPRSAHATP